MNSSLKKAQDYVDKFNKNCKNNYCCYGIQGPTGPVGPTGPAGPLSLNISGVTTVSADNPAQIVNHGDDENVELEFFIPMGPTVNG